MRVLGSSPSKRNQIFLNMFALSISSIYLKSSVQQTFCSFNGLSWLNGLSGLSWSSGLNEVS